MLDGYTEEFNSKTSLSEAKQTSGWEWLTTIPGIGECSAMMVLAEIGADRTISQPRSVVQLRRAGAAGAGVVRERPAVWDHAAGLAWLREICG